MPRDGSGNYSLPSGNPVVTNTIISSGGWANPTLSDIATAITQSLSRDGQTTPTANLSMGNFRLTALANAVARTDAVNAGQIQDGALITLGSVAGTDTITASSSPAITAYTAGQRFQFVAAGANTTTTPTLNINGLGAKNITRRGASAPVAGEIASGQLVTVVYDGTQFQLQTAAYGTLINVQTITSSGTYTPTPGTNSIVAEIQGGGGAGGGAAVTGGAQFSGGAGGSAGGYIKHRMTSGFSGASVTIGAAGAASAGAGGGAGGNTLFGALTANGGPGGPFAAAGTTFNANGVAGGSASGGSILNIKGGAGAPSASTGSVVIIGSGANSPLGSGGAPGNISAGGAAGGYGAGGGGAYGNNAAAIAGGAGAPGVVIVWEYA